MTKSEPSPSALEPWPAEGPARVVFQHDYFRTLVEEDLRLPNGRRLTWLRYADQREGHHELDGVMAICVRDQEVLLARQYNPGPQRVIWEFPGGGTNLGEGYEDAVQRELMEEVGLFPNAVTYLGRFLIDNRRSGWGIRAFVASDLEPRKLPADESEFIESSFVPIESVDEMIRAGVIDNCIALAGWALFKASGGP